MMLYIVVASQLYTVHRALDYRSSQSCILCHSMQGCRQGEGQGALAPPDLLANIIKMRVWSCKRGCGSAKISHTAPPLLKIYLHPCNVTVSTLQYGMYLTFPTQFVNTCNAVCMSMSRESWYAIVCLLASLHNDLILYPQETTNYQTAVEETLQQYTSD